MPSRLQYLSPTQYAGKILVLTRRMLEHARLGEWENFAELELQRQDVLQTLFEHPAMPQALEEVQLMLQEVVELDKTSIALGEDEKQRLGEFLSARRQARKAMRAYHHHRA